MTVQREDFPEPSPFSTSNAPTAPGADNPTASSLAPKPKDEVTPWGLLSLLAETLDDLERTRIAAENRARALAQVYELDGTPAYNQAVTLAEAIKALEHGAELQLKRALRAHPLGPWVKQTNGVGEKQGARLLAAVGDPYWNTLYDRPRTVSELWAYCGYHVLSLGRAAPGTQSERAEGAQTGGDTSPAVRDNQVGAAGVAASRHRGSRANWSTTAKMRAFLIAESCIKKSASPYRPVYDGGRAKYADAVHAAGCRRCGPAGKPAAIGSPLSAGHQHARALRLVAKEILKDLWRESKQLREEGGPDATS